MVINFHVHMMRYQVDWPRELGEFYIKEMFQGDCWHTGKPWRPEDFCVPVERLIKDMDAGKIDKAVVLGVGYMPWNAYDPNSAEYVKSVAKIVVPCWTMLRPQPDSAGFHHKSW